MMVTEPLSIARPAGPTSEASDLVRDGQQEWYAFPEGDRRRIAPAFRLTASSGKRITLANYRGRSNLVLLFVHGADCAACQAALKTFADHRADYQAQTAEVLIVWPAAPDRTPVPPGFGLPGLADPGGETRRAYAARLPTGLAGDAMLFVLDRYGAPYAALTGPELDDPGLQQEVLEWLAFIEVQCPE
jgi:peroxiredoxin